MSILYVTRQGVVLATLAAVGIAGIGVAHSSGVGRASAAPLACDIAVSRSGRMIELQALVSAPAPVTGSYRLNVVSSGANSASINQSGEFSLEGGSAVVSAVSLGGGDTYTARLTVKADGRTAECRQRVGGSL